MSANRPLTPKENKTANILCGISVGCMSLPFIDWLIQWYVMGMAMRNMEPAQQAQAVQDGIYVTGSAALSLLSVAGFVAAIVLMIVVRVKYPSNIFGKVLMWTYIVLVTIALIIFIVLAIACSIACGNFMNGCGEGCQSCQNLD